MAHSNASLSARVQIQFSRAVLKIGKPDLSGRISTGRSWSSRNSTASFTLRWRQLLNARPRAELSGKALDDPKQSLPLEGLAQIGERQA